MKVTNIRRKLIATLAAGGLLVPSAVEAANLDTNLVVNPGFEDVDFGVTGGYGEPSVLNWSGVGMAFSHDGSGGIPDYANGTEPPGGGSWYFAPGYIPTDGVRHHSLETAITQTINVGSGPTGTRIAAGTAHFLLSAYFSTYQGQIDHGVLQVDFLDASEAILGTGQATPGPVNLTEWTYFFGSGPIPVGTNSVKVSAWGVLASAGNASDGYMDNVDFRVTGPLGDLNADGVLSPADWAIVRSNQHKDLSGNSPDQAYLLGDINRDLANDYTDFRLFKDLYDAANGVGAFSAMVAAVPEPSSLSIVVSAGLLLMSAVRGKTMK